MRLKKRIRKAMRNKIQKSVILLLALVLTIVIWQPSAAKVYAQGKATVTVASGLIREKANPTSTVLASIKQNDALDVIAQTTGSDGYTWYKVFVDAQRKGYVRGDLVSVEGTIPTESAAEEGSTSTDNTASSDSTTTTVGSGGNVTVVGSNNETSVTETSTETAAVGQVTPSQVATARVKEQVNVRAGAGTDYNKVTSAAVDTQVNVSGQATDKENKLWYQVSYTAGDKMVNGYIREDFLEVLEMAAPEPVPEEPIVEEPVTEEPVNQDYMLQYQDDGTGQMDWYLINNIEGTSQSLTELLEAVRLAQENTEIENDQAGTMKIVIAILAIALVILVVAVTLLLFKLKDSYEYYEEEEEDGYGLEEEDDEEDDEEEDNEEDEDEEDAPVRASANRLFGRNKGRLAERGRTGKERELSEESPRAKESAPVSQSSKNWQSKDFLEMDDDMEFEFLDL